MTDTVRYGIVGAGLMAREHIRNLAVTPGAVITALADPIESSLASSREALELGGNCGTGASHVASFADSQALAVSGLVDAVVVASPNFTHRSVLEPLFDAKLAILCEKPLATTLADARWVVDRAGQSSAPFWTAMEYRYMPPVAEFISAIHDGAVGRLQMLSMREHRFPFLPKVGDWNRFSRNTGGTMVEKCCHFFDLMRLIVQAEPVRVYCSGAMDVNHQDERYEGEKPDILDNSFTTVDFTNGVRAMLDLSMFAEGAKNQEELTVVGDNARLDVFIPEGALVMSPRVGLGHPKQVTRRIVETDEVAMKAGAHHGSTFYEHQKFNSVVRGEGLVEVTAVDGLRAVAIGIAAEMSAREKRVVEMTELDF